MVLMHDTGGCSSVQILKHLLQWGLQLVKVWLHIAWLGFNCLRGAGKFSFHQHVRDGFGMYLPSCSMGTRWWRSFLRGKRIQNMKLVLRSENILSIPYMPLVHIGSMLLGSLVLCYILNLVDLVNRMSCYPFTWISVVEQGLIKHSW